MSPAVTTAMSLRLLALGSRVLVPVRLGSKRWPGASVVGVSASRYLNVQAATEATAGKLKSIDELPGPSLATTLYWLLVKGYADKSHLLQVGVMQRGARGVNGEWF